MARITPNRVRGTFRGPVNSFSSFHRMINQWVAGEKSTALSRLKWILILALVTALLVTLYPFVARRNQVADDVIIARFPKNFTFGVATAPAHVEDQLEDSWLEWGRSGQIPFFQNVSHAEDRLLFWTSPEKEIHLAYRTGAKVSLNKSFLNLINGYCYLQTF